LWGVLFAVKDNIDVAGLPTTAASPPYAYMPSGSSAVVQALLDAGALPVGKTNLDQFATGLVGTRSPYGVPRNARDARYIPGGSSSGSASAVAAGLVAFALGTDTAGSGRVPACFQELVGYKPTRGLVSTSGVVPACRTLDCVTVFAPNVSDARLAARFMTKFDALDPYAREVALTRTSVGPKPQLGVPRADQRALDPAYGAAFEAALAAWKAKGAEVEEFDASEILEAARLLYEGPWVAERRAAVGEFWNDAEAFHPVTRRILATADGKTAQQAFEAQYRLEALKRSSAALWGRFDALALPTTVTMPTLEEEAAEPVAVNSRLGTWTNMFNLLDWAGLAVPAARTADGRPFGITLAAPAGSDGLLWQLGERWEGRPGVELGPTVIAVAGAHLRGLPLNGQLTERGARFLREAATAPEYELWAFADGRIEKPGLVRTTGAGISVPLELWDMPETGWASFLALIPAPLGLGKIKLDDGRWVTGFLMEAVQRETAQDIARFGGWRAYAQSKR